MDNEDKLCVAALQWLDQSGGLSSLRSALMARSCLPKPPKVLSNPVYINLMQLWEINEELAELVVCRPMEAQRVFHHVLHVASVATMLQIKTEPTSPTDDLDSNDNQRAPGPITKLPDLGTHMSLYPENEKIKKDDTIDLEITVDRINLNLTLQSLASNLPIDTSVASETPGILTSSQIYAPLRVCGMSGVDEWIIDSVKDLPLQLLEPRLAVVSGRLLSISLPSKYTKWARYICSQPGCLGTERDLHVRVFVVGRSEAETIRDHPICRVCNSALVEDPSSRELGEKISVVIDRRPSRRELREADKHFQTLKLVLRDEMKEGLEPGQPIEATVMVSPKNFPKLPSLESILVYPRVPLRPPSSLPPVFRRLVDDRVSSPWSLVLTIAYMFAASVTPAGTFHTLKMALLLSLASCSSHKAGLAVLAVGSNTTLLLRLLWWSAHFAPQTVIHSSLDAATASCLKSREGTIWVQAGSLLRAHGGVCVLGEFSKFKKDLRQSVCRALESGRVRVECSTHLRKVASTLSYPLRAAAWACYDPSTARNTTTVEVDDNFLHVPLGDLTKSITDVFGLVVYSETPGGECEKEAENVITLQTLLQATKSQSQDSFKPLLPSDELVQYLNVVRGIRVKFSATAEKLIRGYYVATRRLRGDCVQGSTVPITAIHTLAQVAASHARLALRSSVEGWDAATAVLLCEEALAAHTGYSLLHVQPAPHLPHNTDLHTLVGRKNDERMANFQRSLEMFIDTHTGDMVSGL